jgi:hypothetical protein
MKLSFGFLDLRQSVGLFGRWSARRKASTCTQTQKTAHTHTHTHKQTLNIRALSVIRTHDPGFRASENSACLRPLGYRDRLREKFTLKKMDYRNLNSLKPIGNFLFILKHPVFVTPPPAFGYLPYIILQCYKLYGVLSWRGWNIIIMWFGIRLEINWRFIAFVFVRHFDGHINCRL